jgi:hypothetical protein
MSTAAVIATQAPREQQLSKVPGFDSTATSDYSRPIIAVKSVDGAKHRLLSYLALANPLYNLRLRIPEAVLYSKPVEHILRTVLQQKLFSKIETYLTGMHSTSVRLMGGCLRACISRACIWWVCVSWVCTLRARISGIGAITKLRL